MRLLFKLKSQFLRLAPGLRYDVAFLILSQLLALGIPTRTLLDRPILAGALMIAFLVLQASGAILKRAPMHARMPESMEDRGNPVWMFTLFAAPVYVVLCALGVYMLLDHNQDAIVWGLGAGVVAVFFIIRAMVRPREIVTHSRYGWQELLADFLLLVSALILTRLFWEPLILESARGTGSIARGLRSGTGSLIAYTMVLGFIFGIFYAGPRLVLLYEDLHSRLTWLRMGLIYLVYLLRVFNGLFFEA
ncbi:MAG: hypothetical protein KDK30_15695 [Leptospiraceae bacterium]|nr:hypothetical protein [Leptospiraceae bacterium]